MLPLIFRGRHLSRSPVGIADSHFSIYPRKIGGVQSFADLIQQMGFGDSVKGAAMATRITALQHTRGSKGIYPQPLQRMSWVKLAVRLIVDRTLVLQLKTTSCQYGEELIQRNASTVIAQK
jgi:hypothetical protein